MTSVLKNYSVILPLAALVLAFWFSPDLQEVAAGVAIFLFGILMLQDGFKRLGGGNLEHVLEAATRSTPRALAFGPRVEHARAVQLPRLGPDDLLSQRRAYLADRCDRDRFRGESSGTTTGTWLVAGLGLKVDIAAYAMPMIAFAVVLVFQKARPVRGFGYVLAGAGFLFLGIFYMKDGFEAFRDGLDLARFALPGILGLLVYTALGAAATVILQSSHATMVLVITALAAGQITYENAIALAVGANIGTTVTAIIGGRRRECPGQAGWRWRISSSTSSRRRVALILVAPLTALVDVVAQIVGIAAEDYALKLAVFQTIFNTLGVILMLPLTRRLVTFLERYLPEPEPDVSRPRYLNAAIDDYPETLERALRQEVSHLYDNAVKLVLHGAEPASRDGVCRQRPRRRRAAQPVPHRSRYRG